MTYHLETASWSEWLDGYKRAWEERDPELAVALFTEDASYRETPFDAPFEGRAAIRDYWAKAVSGQRDVTFTYEPIACAGDEGVCRWHAAFTGAAGGEQIDLDGIFRCRFESAGQVSRLEEWWHIRVVPAG